MYCWSLSQNKPEEVLTVIIVLKEPLTILVSIDGFYFARELSILENLTSMWESDAHKQYSLVHYQPVKSCQPDLAGH